MVHNSIGDMTINELRRIIREEISLQYGQLSPIRDSQKVQEALDWLKVNRWTPPAGTPSTLELLREDRDQ